MVSAGVIVFALLACANAFIYPVGDSLSGPADVIINVQGYVWSLADAPYGKQAPFVDVNVAATTPAAAVATSPPTLSVLVFGKDDSAYVGLYRCVFCVAAAPWVRAWGRACRRARRPARCGSPASPVG